MKNPNRTTALTPAVRSLLSRLRNRIRAYVWVEGLALAVSWVCLTFWIGLALDYLPVLVGATEMPRAARAVMLTVIAGILAFILYRWILRRAFVRLADRSMAVLLERRFASFHDGLVTAVEMADRPEHATEFDVDMLRHTSDEATSGLRDVRLGSVFNFRPLMLSLFAATLLSLTVVGFATARPVSFRIAFDRLYRLDDVPWPRKARIEVVGIVMDRSALPAESRTALPVIPFDDDGVVKVAKGSSVELLVRADASSAVSVVPDYCYVDYRTSEGDRGRARMAQVGQRESQQQRYAYRDRPFERIAASIDFSVLGYDHRVAGLRLELVNNPAVVKTTLDCVYPEYTGMVRDLGRPFSPGMSLPKGTSVTIRCRSNKPLVEVYVLDLETRETRTIEPTRGEPTRGESDGGQSDGGGSGSSAGDAELAATGFEYQVPPLENDLSLEFTLRDTDNVIGQESHHVFISVTPDEEPSIVSRLGGVSTVITPDVIMPYSGSIVDDFGVTRAWFQVEHRAGQGEPEFHEIEFPLGVERDVTAPQGRRPADEADPNAFAASIDFRALRQSATPFRLEPKDQIVVSVRARDNCGLSQGVNEGSGDRLQFDVVTPDELLAMLEAREIGLRRRFEQIIDEMSATRDSLLYVQSDLRGRERITEPGDRADPRPLDQTEEDQTEEDQTEEDQTEEDQSEEDETEEDQTEEDQTEEDQTEEDQTEEDQTEESRAAAADPEPGDESSGTVDGEKRARSLRVVRVQHAASQTQKISQEVLGVAESFSSIRLELINNRIDTADRKQRLEEKVAQPLRQVVETLFPALGERLKQLEQVLDDEQQNEQIAGRAVQQADDILAELNAVLQDMLTIETYNEMLDIVRSLIEEQAKLNEETKRERSKGLFED